MNTAVEYHDYLSSAYDYFNRNLFEPTFGITLPECVITLSHKKNSRAYYWHNIYNDKLNETNVAEIAICYNSLKNDTVTILSSLVHEMCHCLDEYLGTACKAPWHGKDWSNYMLACALIPHSTTDVTKMVGNYMSHTVVDGGIFKNLALEFISEHGEFALAQNKPAVNEKKEPKKRPVFSCKCNNKITMPKGLVNVLEIKCKQCHEVLKISE